MKYEKLKSDTNRDGNKERWDESYRMTNTHNEWNFTKKIRSEPVKSDQKEFELSTITKHMKTKKRLIIDKNKENSKRNCKENSKEKIAAAETVEVAREITRTDECSTSDEVARREMIDRYEYFKHTDPIHYANYDDVFLIDLG